MMHACAQGSSCLAATPTSSWSSRRSRKGSGWDGVLVREAACGIDAWGLLSAIAVRDLACPSRYGADPLPWRRPWKVASRVATLDQLSGGRAIVTVGDGR